MAEHPLKMNGGLRYFYEFSFHQTASRVDGPVAPVSSRTAKLVRAELDKVLAENDLSMDTPKGVPHMDDSVDPPVPATDEQGRTLYEVLPVGPRSFYTGVDEAFRRVLGDDYTPQFTDIASNPGQHPLYRQDLTQVNSYLDTYDLLPVSPYDPRWADRSVALDNGTALLGIPMATVREEVFDETSARYADNGLTGLDRLVMRPTNESQYATFDVVLADTPMSDRNPERKIAGKAFNAETDLPGLSVLRPFMSDEEYTKVAAHVRTGLTDERGVVDPSKGVSPEVIRNAAAVIEYVASTGEPFTVEPDLRPGQVCVKLGDNRGRIRLLDNNPSMVGRTYRDGVNTRFKLKHNEENVVPGPDDAVALVKFGMGRQVGRADGKGLVGKDGFDNYRTRTSLSLGYNRDDLTFFVENESAFSTGARFTSREDAQTFVEEGIASAKANFVSQVDLDGLVTLFEENADDPDFVPEFSGTPEIVGLQQAYWKALSTGEVDLLVPGFNRADELAALDSGDDYAIEEMSLLTDLDEAKFDAEQVAHPNSDAMIVAQLRRHMELSRDELFGDAEVSPYDGQRFDPVKVAAYMESDSSPITNNNSLVTALRVLDIPAAELKGEEFAHTAFKDRLINFEPELAVDMREHDSEFIRRVAEEISDSVALYGGEVTSMEIDDKGVVQWRGTTKSGARASTRKSVEIGGTMGQILVPGEYGEITTRLGSGEDHMFVPGYVARVQPQAPGEHKTFEERTRLRGYEQTILDGVREEIVSAMSDRTVDLSGYDNYDEDVVSQQIAGDPVSLNGRVRRLYANRHPVDFIDRSLEEGMTQEEAEAILRTEGLRVRYDNSLLKGASTRSVMQLENRLERDGVDLETYLANDNRLDAVALTGGRNITLVSEEQSNGFFDPVMTGTGSNQGLVRYLVPDAQVNETGEMIPGSGEQRVPVADLEIFRAAQYDPHDRQNMSLNNYMHSSATAKQAGTAMMEFGGWNFEDGIVVNTAFAKEHQLRGADGEMRDLVIGDKLSDAHGNKGVISLVVDPEMDPVEAEARGISEQVEFFRDNQGVEVVMSPFSAISRHNGGTARELMENPGDLVVRDAEGNATDVPGGYGGLDLMITHMAVDAKTNVYDAEAVAAGRGRKASSQLAWALQAQGCEKIMSDFYGNNTGAFANAKEYLTVLGYGLTDDGTLLPNTDSEELLERRIFSVEDYMAEADRPSYAVNAFAHDIATSGGTLVLPFEITLKNGERTNEVPLLSAHLRSERDLGDGTVSQHDHTAYYLSLFKAAATYVSEQDKAKAAELRMTEAREAGDTGTVRTEQKKMDTAVSRLASNQVKVQSAYNNIAGDIVSRRIEGKHNMFRDGLMSSRQSHSATAVWTGDPRLKVNQVAMNSKMAAELGVDVNAVRSAMVDPENTSDEKRHVLVFRDPVLRAGALRYLEVQIDDELTGVAVNPVIVKSMDGDFDGDSVGLIGNLSKGAHAEAMSRLSMEANLLDHGTFEFADDGKYPLALHDQLDTKVAEYANPEFAERMNEIVTKLNEIEADESLSREERTTINKAYMEDLSEFYAETFNCRDERVRIRFGSIDDHMASVDECHITGAKGSPKKVNEYAEYLSVEKDSDGHYADEPHQGEITDDLRDRYLGSQRATAFKSELTGTAGTKSQQAVQLLRVHGAVEQATELTMPATQAMLQAKKDPVDAAYRAEVISGPLSDAWAGMKLNCETVDGRLQWSRDYDNGEPVRATTTEFREQMMAMMTSDAGMGVNLNEKYVAEVASMLDDGTGHIVDTSRENWDELSDGQKPLALDRLAYSCSFDEFAALAESKSSLFEGPNVGFAPRPVKENMATVARELAEPEAEMEPAELHKLVKKDVVDGYVAKPKSKGPVRSVGTPGRKTRVPSWFRGSGTPSVDSNEVSVKGYDGMNR